MCESSKNGEGVKPKEYYQDIRKIMNRIGGLATIDGALALATAWWTEIHEDPTDPCKMAKVYANLIANDPGGKIANHHLPLMTS